LVTLYYRPASRELNIYTHYSRDETEISVRLSNHSLYEARPTIAAAIQEFQARPSGVAGFVSKFTIERYDNALTSFFKRMLDIGPGAKTLHIETDGSGFYLASTKEILGVLLGG
jgi:hypothetical protein